MRIGAELPAVRVDDHRACAIVESGAVEAVDRTRHRKRGAALLEVVEQHERGALAACTCACFVRRWIRVGPPLGERGRRRRHGGEDDDELQQLHHPNDHVVSPLVMVALRCIASGETWAAAGLGSRCGASGFQPCSVSSSAKPITYASATCHPARSHANTDLPCGKRLVSATPADEPNQIIDPPKPTANATKPQS